MNSTGIVVAVHTIGTWFAAVGRYPVSVRKWNTFAFYASYARFLLDCHGVCHGHAGSERSDVRSNESHSG